MNKNMLYRSIPKVDVLLEHADIRELICAYGRNTVLDAIRLETDRIRQMIEDGQHEEKILLQVERLPEQIVSFVKGAAAPRLRSVVNATGTILHTNLGRAPLSSEHISKILSVVTGYSNLEYDLLAGCRGERYDHFADLLCQLTGAEAAMAVNNNAAAVLLVLSSLAHGGEVIVSRGELVEIGGKFRIPDVCAQSGASMVEIGTTNKTHLSDYEDHITEATRALLKVHTSNYRIVGFTESVSVAQLKPLAKAHRLPIIEDLGSGVLVDVRQFGLPYEPTVSDAIRQGADIVCFSGDKLLGGPQAGIIVGKKSYIDQIKKNPLTRALRIDKFTAAALELTLKEYCHEETLKDRIPVLRMISATQTEIGLKAKLLYTMLAEADLKATIQIEDCVSQIGGGSLPTAQLDSVAVTVRPLRCSVQELEKALRSAQIPVIGRIAHDRLYLDLRTVEDTMLQTVAATLKEVLV